MRFIFIIYLIIGISVITFSQKRKLIKENNINKKVEWKYQYKGGKEKKIKQSEHYFDKNGNETELIEFDEYGKITKHVKTVYDNDNKEVKVVYLNADNSIKKTIKYKYENGMKTEKTIYDSNNKIKSKRVYEYLTY